MLHPERESLYCSTHMGVMPPTSVLAGNKTVCTVGMSGKQSKCLCMSHGENIPHHQVWTSPLALLIRWARAMLFARGLDEPAFALQPLSSCLFERPLPSPSVVSSRTKKPSASVPVWVLASHLATASESECNIARYQANHEFFLQSWNSKRVSFFQTIRVRSYFVTSWYVHLRILTFESWDFFLGRLLRRVKKSAVTSRTRVFSRILLNMA